MWGIIWIKGAHCICILLSPLKQDDLVSLLYNFTRPKKGHNFLPPDYCVICTQCSYSWIHTLHSWIHEIMNSHHAFMSWAIYLIFLPAATARKVQKDRVQELMLMLSMFACWKNCLFAFPNIFLRHLVCWWHLTKNAFSQLFYLKGLQLFYS